MPSHDQTVIDRATAAELREARLRDALVEMVGLVEVMFSTLLADVVAGKAFEDIKSSYANTELRITRVLNSVLGEAPKVGLESATPAADGEAPPSYEACQQCLEARKRCDWVSALSCRACGGRGVMPARGASVCNGCGGSLYPDAGTMNEQFVHGLKDVKLVGGYDSKGLIDLHRYTFSLCEVCLRDLFPKWKVPPRVERTSAGMLGWEPIAFGDDQASWEYHHWRESGGHGTARIHGRCNAEIHCPNRAVYSVEYSGHVSDDCHCEDHKTRSANCINATLVPFVRPDWMRKPPPPEPEAVAAPLAQPGEKRFEFAATWALDDTAQSITALMFSTRAETILVRPPDREAKDPPLRVVFRRHHDGLSTSVEDEAGTAGLMTSKPASKTLVQNWLHAMLCRAFNDDHPLLIVLEPDWLAEAPQ